MLVRLDKFLADQNFGTRKHVKKIIRNHTITVDDKLIKDPDFKFNPELQRVFIDGELIEYQSHIYILLNKPEGYICSTIDESYPSVLNLIDAQYQKRARLVGRLDVDTTGVLLITDNGKLNNKLIHPNSGLEKEYLVTYNRNLNDADLQILSSKIDLYDDGIVQAKKVEQVSLNQAKITITEGKYHQIKRMAKRAYLEVIKLDRIRLANLTYGDLKQGEYRFLTEEEIENLKSLVKMEEE